MKASPDRGSWGADPAGFVRSFAEAVPDAVVIADDQGIIQLWNPGAERIFGYREEEAVGRPVSMIVPEGNRAAHEAGLKRVADGGSTYVIGQPVELSGLRSDGTEVPVELSLGPWISPTGTMFCGVIRDISDRGVVDDRLRESESRHRSFVQNATAGIYRSTLDGRFLDVNPALVEILGYGSREELLEVPIAEMYADPECRTEVVADAVESGTIRALDVEWKRRDGEHVHLHVTGTVIRGVQGAPDTFEVIAEDVTELRQAEELVRLQAAGLEAAANAIVFTDPEGTIVWVNAAFTALTGYAREEAVGQNPRVLKSGVQSDDFYGDMWETLLAGRVWKGELVNRRKDGSLYTEEMSIAPVVGRNGTITHYISVKQDISDRVRAREAEQEARVAAEEAASMKSTFVANMSHELRTPMNGIMGMTELLLDTDLNQEQRRSAELVKDSAESLLTIINHVLDYSKVEAGQLEIEEAPFDLSAVVETGVRMFGVAAFSKGIELAYRVDNQLPTTLIGDPGRMRQVITNLVGNALKFTSRGEVVVTVSLEELTDESAVVSIAVRDTGIGIEADKLDLIFEDFSQADSSTTRQYGGTGLGLAITRRIVDLVGGCITVQSTPGEGSLFTVSIPFGLDDTCRATWRLVEDFGRLINARVIVVDDNATNRTLVRGMLSKAGAFVAEAETAAAGLSVLREAAKTDPFDVAIIDCYMPGRDGFELAAEVRREADLDQLKLMMLTSAGRAGDAQRCRDLGISAYLSKPISRVELLDVVAVLLGSDEPEPDSGILITRHSIDEGRARFDVLLVEDNLVNQTVASAMLGKRGHRVTTVGNGALAVEAARKDRYDVILMDIEMPVMDGTEAARNIRRDLGERRPRIIALTAHALATEREEIMSGPFDGFLSKPFKPHELFMAVESVPSDEREPVAVSEGRNERSER
jgi:PAS domain S-box-containing protein